MAPTPFNPPSLAGLTAHQPSGDPSQTAAPGPQEDPKDTDPNDPDYEGPEDGPFQCSNCTYYQDPNQCSQPKIVASQGGQVDPAGCCKFFTSASDGSQSVAGQPSMSPARPNGFSQASEGQS